MNKKTNRKSSFIVHNIFRAVFVLTLGALINVAGGGVDTHALPSISVSSDSNVTITGDDTGGYVTPSASGTLGTGLDHVNVTTNCSAGYKLYVSGTSSGTTDLVLQDAEDPTATTNRISTSDTAVGSESALAKNTWGVGKNGSDFAKIQDYSLNTGTLTPLYTGTDSGTFNIYYGLNIATDKAPGLYTGNVLYTAILDDACLKYTLNFDTSSATFVDSSVFTPKSIDYGNSIDLAPYSVVTAISKTGYTLTGWGYTTSGVEHGFTTVANEDVNPSDLNIITLSPIWTPITYSIVYEAGETGATCSELSVPVNYDADVTLANSTCQKVGYTQDGWSTLPDGTTKDYNLGQILEHPNFSSAAEGSYNLYPHFVINRHLLTVNGDDATVSVSPETGDREYGTPITTTCVSEFGYHCTGWVSADQEVIPNSSTTEYTFSMPDSPVTITATTAPNTYTIRYNGNGGSGTTESQTGQAYGSTTTLRESGFLRAGHHFVGWAYSDSATTPDFTGGQTGVSVTALAENNATGSVVDTNGGTVDLYAIWDINSYNFVFSSNGGTGSASITAASGSYDGTITMSTVGTMTRTNYEFIGWSLSSTSGAEDYTANVTYNVSTLVSAAGKANENNATITIYASWSGYPYTLTTSNGNTTAISSVSPSGSTTKRYGSSVTVTCTSKSGYHCTGWTSSDTSILSSSSNTSYTFSMPGDITLTATGAANTYTIKYNANGGSGTTSSQTGQTYGSTTTLRSNGFSNSGYSFQGWAYSSSASSANFSGGQSNVSVSTLAANNYNGSVVNTNGGTINLYAVWKPNTYTVAYSAGNTGGSCSISSTSATYDSYVTLSSSTCTKAGYHQDGWSTSNSSSNSKNYNLGYRYAYNLTTSGTTYLYPHFVPNTYYIYYYANGGSGSVSSQTVTYGNNVTLRANNFSRSGYDYLGWGSSSASSASYSPSTSYSVSSLASWAGVTNTDGGSINLYAVWQQQVVYKTVTLSAGTCISSVSGGGSKVVGNSVSISASMSTGCHFSNWSTSSSGVSFGNSSSSSTSFTMPNNDVTITANGAYNTYTISYNANGGSGSTSSQSATYGNNVTLNSNGFSRSGYVFSGWSMSSSATSASYSAGSSYAVSSLASSASVTNSNGSTITLYAVWTTPQKYTVTFNKNGGSSVSTSSKTVTNGETYGTLPTAKKKTTTSGPTSDFHQCTDSVYSLKGWYTATSGGTKITSDTIVNLTGNQTLYAQWNRTDNVRWANQSTVNGIVYYSC